MKLILIISVLYFFASIATAQDVASAEEPKEIKKEMPQKKSLKPQAPTAQVAEAPKMKVVKRNLVGFNLDAHSTLIDEPTQKYTKNEFSTFIKSGWNGEDIEMGPLLLYSYSRSSLSEDKSYGFGGFIDINFDLNDGKNVAINALRTSGIVKITDYSAKSTNGTSWSAEFGYAHKWFGLSRSWAVDLNAGYGFNLISEQEGSSQYSGFFTRVGLQTYY
jgi:hypothetical protein